MNQILTVIGALDSENDNIIYDIIKEMFIKIGYRIIYEKQMISLLIYGKSLILMIRLTPDMIDHIYGLGLDIDILLHKSIDTAEYANSHISDMIGNTKYIIMNIDDKEAKYILSDDIDGLVISYGINPKATITASSFDFSNNSRFNLCLQREYRNLHGDKIEPMELPIVLNLMGKSNIYYGLGAIACGLTCGIDIDVIKDALFSIRGMNRYLEKIYDGSYMIVDNRCNLPSDYDLILEEIQNIKYRDGYIVNGIEIDEGIYTVKNNLRIIINWAPILNIRKIYFYMDKEEDLIIDNINLLFERYEIEYEIFLDLRRCLHNSIQGLEDGDLLLLMGGDSLEEGKTILKSLI
ncbi:MAG: hypothetical protein GX329_05640 [Tissierellia bacterium]|nr:hypothetical protein [Tissierellia bacterium]